MRALMPAQPLVNLRQDLDRMFKQFWNEEYREFPTVNEWTPVLDIVEDKDAIIVKAEIPGIEPKDIQIQLREQWLILKGEKKFEKLTREDQYHRIERAYGAFARTIELPVHVDDTKVMATFRNGLLTITMPKLPESLGRTIQIKSE